MKKNWAFLIFTIVFAITACQSFQFGGNVIRGSGNVKSETRRVSDFDRVSICCGMQLLFSQGTEETLEIEAEDNLLPEIVSEVVNGQLTIHFKDPMGAIRYRVFQPIRVKVSAIEIHGLEVSGGGSLESGQIDTDRLNLDMSGGSKAELGPLTGEALVIDISGGGHLTTQNLTITGLELNLSGGSTASIQDFNGETLRLEGSGGSKTQIAGSVANQEVSLSGGAGLEAADLESETVKIEMSGGGRAAVWVNGSLDASLSGGARVEYYGRPSITEDLSGGSKLVSRGEK